MNHKPHQSSDNKYVQLTNTHTHTFTTLNWTRYQNINRFDWRLSKCYRDSILLSTSFTTQHANIFCLWMFVFLILAQPNIGFGLKMKHTCDKRALFKALNQLWIDIGIDFSFNRCYHSLAFYVLFSLVSIHKSMIHSLYLRPSNELFGVSSSMIGWVNALLFQVAKRNDWLPWKHNVSQ